MSVLPTNFLTVAAPPFVASPYGLVVAATMVDDLNERWRMGAVFLSNAAAVATAIDDPDVCAAHVKSVVTLDDWLTGIAVTLYYRVGCGPPSHSLAEQTEQVRNAVLRGESRGLEKVLWAWVQADGIAGGTAVGAALAIGTGEALIGDLYGGTGVIHLSHLVAAKAAAANMLTRTGVRCFTTSGGTPVVVGDGYPSATSGLLATGPIAIHRGPVTVLDPVAGYSMRDNRSVVTAERSYLIVVDAPRAHVALT